MKNNSISTALEQLGNSFEGKDNINILDLRDVPMAVVCENFGSSGSNWHQLVMEANTELQEMGRKGGDNKNLYWNQPLIETDAVSGNRTLYTDDGIKKAIEDNRIQHQLKMNIWFGEYDHALELKTMDPAKEMKKIVYRTMYVDPKNTSHFISSIEWKGKVLYGKCGFAWTDIGAFVKNQAIHEGSLFDMSVRALAKKQAQESRNGVDVMVRKEMMLATFDMVTYPGFAIASMDNGTMKKDVKSYLKQAHEAKNINIDTSLDADTLFELVQEGSDFSSLSIESEDLFGGSKPDVIVDTNGKGVYKDAYGFRRTVCLDHMSIVTAVEAFDMYS